jgi:hypothetical protein
MRRHRTIAITGIVIIIDTRTIRSVDFFPHGTSSACGEIGAHIQLLMKSLNGRKMPAFGAQRCKSA